MFGHWLTLGALALLPVLTPTKPWWLGGPPPGVLPVLEFGDIDLLPMPPATRGGADYVLVCRAKDPGPGLYRDAGARAAEQRYLDEMLGLARYLVQHPDAATWDRQLASDLRDRMWVVMHVQPYYDGIEAGPAKLGIRRGSSPGAQHCGASNEPAGQLRITTPRSASLQLDTVTDYIAWAWTLVVVMLPLPETWQQTLNAGWIHTAGAWLEWSRPSWFTPVAWAGGAWSWAGGALGWWGGAGEADPDTGPSRRAMPDRREPPTALGPVNPSFDCRKAQTNMERLICGHPDLAAADAQLGLMYRTLFDLLTPGQRDVLKDDQRQWIRERDQAVFGGCASPEAIDMSCVLALYQQRYDTLATVNQSMQDRLRTRTDSAIQAAPQRGPRVLVPQQPKGIY